MLTSHASSTLVAAAVHVKRCVCQKCNIRNVISVSLLCMCTEAETLYYIFSVSE